MVLPDKDARDERRRFETGLIQQGGGAGEVAIEAGERPLTRA